MVVMKYFCIYFPIRLGVIISSIFSSLQSVVVLVFLCVKNTEYFKAEVKDFEDNLDDFTSNEFFEKFLNLAGKYTFELRMAVIAFSVFFIVSCGLNVIAGLKIWRLLSIPYIALDFIRLSVFLTGHVTTCMIYKKQLNLGVLIAASCAGGFVLLFLGYFWCCSIAFFQIVGVVNTKSYRKMVSMGSPSPQKIQRNITISSIAPTLKQSNPEMKFEKSIPPPGIFISDFSGFNRKNVSQFRM